MARLPQWKAEKPKESRWGYVAKHGVSHYLADAGPLQLRSLCGKLILRSQASVGETIQKCYQCRTLRRAM